MNTRVFALAAIGIGTCVLLDGSVKEGVLLMLAGLIFGLLSFLPLSRVYELKCDIQSAKKGFAKCLEEYFPMRHFSFDTFDSIKVIVAGNHFLCKIGHDDNPVAFGEVILSNAPSATGPRIIVCAADGRNSVVANYSRLDLESYWRKGGTQPPISTNEPWERLE